MEYKIFLLVTARLESKRKRAKWTHTFPVDDTGNVTGKSLCGLPGVAADMIYDNESQDVYPTCPVCCHRTMSNAGKLVELTTHVESESIFWVCP